MMLDEFKHEKARSAPLDVDESSCVRAFWARAAECEHRRPIRVDLRRALSSLCDYLE